MRRAPLTVLAGLALAACGGGASRAAPAAYDLATEGTGGAAAGSGGGQGGALGAAACGPVASDPAGGGAAQPPSTTIVSMSAATTSEHEPHLARSASGALAVVWMGYATNVATSIGYVLSPDGGATWPTPQALVSPSGNRSADPSVVADACGGFHLSFLVYTQTGTSSPQDTRVYVASAAPGATAFGEPRQVSAAPAGLDKPWIAVTPRGALLVCHASSGGVACARSVDGASWQPSKVMGTGGDVELPFVCTSGDDARVYVAYMTFAGPRLSWSDDDGASWPASASRAVSAPGETSVGVLETPSCVVAGGELVVSYGVSTDPMPASTSPRLSAIRLARSVDRGATFASYGTLSVPGTSFLHPTLARDGDGTLHLAYYQGVADGDLMGAFTYARAASGTLSFSTGTALTPLAFTTSRGAPPWHGDYGGLITQDGALWAAYAGSPSGGAAHVGVLHGPPP